MCFGLKQESPLYVIELELLRTMWPGAQMRVIMAQSQFADCNKVANDYYCGGRRHSRALLHQDVVRAQSLYWKGCFKRLLIELPLSSPLALPSN
jgi:hypothetical protein